MVRNRRTTAPDWAYFDHDLDGLSANDPVDANVDHLDSSHLVIIDSSVENQTELIADVKSHHPDALIEIIDKDQNGIVQISDLLSRQTGLRSVHIVSHGTAGQLQLGSTKLSFDGDGNHTCFVGPRHRQTNFRWGSAHCRVFATD